jgi:hypothetical protein
MLPGNAAVRADNVRLVHGRLEAWRAPRFIADLGDACAAAVHDCCWRGSDDYCMNFTLAKTCNEMYLSTPCDCPRVLKDFCSDDDPIYLGLDQPAAPTITSDTGAVDEACTQLRAYRITYCGECGEGAASKPSRFIKFDKATEVKLDLPQPDGKYDVSHINVYATHVTWDSTQGYLSGAPTDYAAGYLSIGDSASDWFLVGSVPVGDLVFCDEGGGATETLGHLLTTSDWLPPPEGMVIGGETAAGSLVGFCPGEQRIYLSERNAYHAWPRRKCKQIECRVRAVCVIEDTVIVLTDGDVYLFSDSATGEFESREAAPMRRLRVPYPIVSAKSLVCTRAGAIYASRDGLVRVTAEGGIDLISTTHFAPDDWEQIDPGSIRAAEYQGAYVFTSSRFSGVFDLNLQGVTSNLPQNLTTLCFAPTCWITDKQGRLFYLLEGKVYQFDAGPGYMNYDYETAVSQLPTDMSLSAAQLEYTGVCPDEADTQGVTVEIIGDCRVICVDQVKDNCPYRINLQMVRQLSVRLRGSRSLRRMCVAVDMPQLRIL